MAEVAGVVSSMLRYFNSPTHSDVLVHSGNKTFHAHKLVLSAGCEYFRACFEGGFKETTGSSIRLHGASPEAIHDLLKFLYCCFVDDGWFVEDILHTYEALIHCANVYVAAHKYLLPELCEQASSSFREILADDCLDDAWWEVLHKTVMHVYVDFAEEATVLRECLVAEFMLMTNVTSAGEDPRCKALLLAVPGFAAEVATSLLLERKQRTRAKSASKGDLTSQVPKKRKTGTKG